MTQSFKYELPDVLIPKAPEGPPPKFGHEMLQHWGFDPNYLNFNNGAFTTSIRHFADRVPALNLILLICA